MKLEVLLSVMNFTKKDLDKMNITSDTIVINQCDREDFETYKNYRVFYSKEVGLSNSRNMGIKNAVGDILVLCDDDVIYKENYEKLIVEEFEKNKNADIIVFNIDSPNRKIKLNKKNKRLHFYNILRYTSTRVAFRTDVIQKSGLKFNPLFGPGSKYLNGEESIFLTQCLRKGLKIYSSTNNIATVLQNKSTWFKGYDEKYFFDKGAIYTAVNKRIRHILILQFLLRHREVLTKIKFMNAYKIMLKGSKDYLETIKRK